MPKHISQINNITDYIKGWGFKGDCLWIFAGPKLAWTKSHRRAGSSYWAGINSVDDMSHKKWTIYLSWTMCHKNRVDEQFVHIFVDDMSGFGVDKQSVHFHFCVRWIVTVDNVYMGLKKQWTITVCRFIQWTKRSWTIHHSTPRSSIFWKDLDALSRLHSFKNQCQLHST